MVIEHLTSQLKEANFKPSYAYFGGSSMIIFIKNKRMIKRLKGKSAPNLLIQKGFNKSNFTEN